MALKKSQLYSSLWQSCDELRGGMDASQYKDYVLTLLFLKYVSDKSKQSDALIEVPKECAFEDMVGLKGDKEIGDKINKIIAKIAEANDLLGVIDQADFNDEAKLGRGKEMTDRLSKLIAIFEGLDFSTNRAEGDDLLGDAYEYLMRHFATESGKSKGQFYTPAEVSRVMSQVIGIERAKELDSPTVYDPTCGSGSLLIKAANEANTPKLAIYGQEMDVATWALAKMNMFLHGYPTAEIWHGNTLSDPHFKNRDGKLKTFDFAVANPPFSQKNWTSGLDLEHDEFDRFDYGIPPAKNGDYAFLLHLVKSLKSSGKGAIILPHGVLFRGNREADIRRELVCRGYIKGVIGLPPNLFYGTGIPACIVVIDKEGAPTRKGIFMIDASKDYIKDGNKNRLREQDIHKIVDVFNNQIEIPGYSRMVLITEIADSKNGYNLNIPRYIDSSESEDLHDLHAHIHGGIPEGDIDALQEYWQVFSTLRQELFQNNGRNGYCEPRIAPNQIKQTITAHQEFTAYAEGVKKIFQKWQEAHRERLMNLKENDHPKTLIRELAEDLLKRFTDVLLLDKYDVYQRLMDYWLETMQDDVYLIVSEGWQEAAKPRTVIEDKARKIKETPDLTIGRQKYKMDLLPPALIVARYFTEAQAKLEDLQAMADEAAQALESFVEEHSGEEGALEDVVNDKGKVTKAAVNQKLKELGADAELAEERQVLEQCLALIEAEAAARKMVKEAQEELARQTLEKYDELTEEEIKTLVIKNKWFAALNDSIEGEIQRVVQRLTERIKELEERYAEPLPEIEKEVETYEAKVKEHLKKMGLEF
ncbi:MAG: type I restriction endonuclease subunit M [Candidatus Schekmanbacteria bacterium]|nr:MAG: type I restriction endonuclease subunit M [Candidatus Schekmanbacteria bacterium]